MSFFTCCFLKSYEHKIGQNIWDIKKISLRVRSPWIVALLSKLWIFVTIYSSRGRLNQQFIWLSTFQKPNLYSRLRNKYRVTLINFWTSFQGLCSLLEWIMHILFSKYNILYAILRYLKGQLISNSRLVSRRFFQKTNGRIWFVFREE